MAEAPLKTPLESLFEDYLETDDSELERLRKTTEKMNLQVASLGDFLEEPYVKEYLQLYLTEDGFVKDKTIDFFLTGRTQAIQDCRTPSPRSHKEKDKDIDEKRGRRHSRRHSPRHSPRHSQGLDKATQKKVCAKLSKTELITIRIHNLAYLISRELGEQCIKRRFGCQNYQNVESGYLEEILVKYFKRKYQNHLQEKSVDDSSDESSVESEESDDESDESDDESDESDHESDESDDESSDESKFSEDEDDKDDFEGNQANEDFLKYWKTRSELSTGASTLLSKPLKKLSTLIKTLQQSDEETEEDVLDKIRKVRIEITTIYEKHKEKMNSQLLVIPASENLTPTTFKKQAKDAIKNISTQSEDACETEDYLRHVYDILVAYRPPADDKMGFVPRISSAFKNLFHQISISDKWAELQSKIKDYHETQDFVEFQKWYQRIIKRKKNGLANTTARQELTNYVDSLFSFQNPFNRLFGVLVVKDGECMVNHDDRVIQLTIVCAKELTYLPVTFRDEEIIKVSPTVGDLLITYFLSFFKHIGYHYGVLEVANECGGEEGEYFGDDTYVGKRQNKTLYCKYEGYGFRESPDLQICFDKDTVFPTMSIDLQGLDQAEIISRGLDRDLRTRVLATKFCSK